MHYIVQCRFYSVEQAITMMVSITRLAFISVIIPFVIGNVARSTCFQMSLKHLRHTDNYERCETNSDARKYWPCDSWFILSK